MGFLRNSTSELDEIRAQVKKENNALPRKERLNNAEIAREVHKRAGWAGFGTKNS